ncbi:AraC family transcriptional regulator ligand-binding domain-containing protein [Pseudomaricurvus sp.]|uniref:AraC family transcriptional regulator n=1 Tax=Pseudomaricurvus sp. TaxID=2004510 RepID=UPI003F6D9B15
MSDNHFFTLDGPLDSMPMENQMRCANLSGFAYLSEQVGKDPREILERHNIDPWLARDPDNHIECQSLVNLLEYCSSSFNDATFGLRLAELQQPDVFGCITALCRSSSRVRQSIHRFIEYMPVVHSPAIQLELVEGTDIAELRWGVRNNLGINDQANYQAAVLIMKLLRQIGGLRFRPSYVNLAVDIRSRDVADLEKILGCHFNKNRTDNAIAFPRTLLERQVPSANNLLSSLLGSYLDQVKKASRKTNPERVQDYVRGALQSHNCSVERCAKKLGMSVRTLQSQLSDAGLKFSDIVQTQRVELAKSYLCQDDLTLDDVAAKLGYAEQCSFGRAFKRWTNQTPKQYRLSQRPSVVA